MNTHLPEQPLQRFPRNQLGRDFVVGDVHGHFELLQRLLDRVGFDPSADRLFAAGDLVDRGPYSPQVLDWLAKPWFASVRGNHEQLVIDVVLAGEDRDLHFRNGGAWLYKLTPVTRERIARRLLQLPLVIEVELDEGQRIGIVHAEAPVSPASRIGAAALPRWPANWATAPGATPLAWQCGRVRGSRKRTRLPSPGWSACTSAIPRKVPCARWATPTTSTRAAAIPTGA